MIRISIILIIAPFVLSDGSFKPNPYPYMGDITSQLYASMENGSKVYKMSNVQDMMDDARRAIVFNFYLIFRGSHLRERTLMCYMTSITYRTAVWDLYRYFHVRDLYVDNLEFEIGYLTQEVIHHYEAILEIYQMVDKRYNRHKEKDFGPISFVFFLYGNILEKSKTIIHLCNMMHEIENKYKAKRSKSVFAEYDDPVRGVRRPKANATIVEVISYEQKKKEVEVNIVNKQKVKERKIYNKKMKKFGITTQRKRRIKKKGVWPINYGWSIEDW